MPKRYGKDIKATAIGRLQAGCSTRQVAAALGVGHMTVARWYGSATGGDLKHRVGKQPTEMGRYLEWLEMYKKGLTTGQISLKVGLKPCTIVRGVRKAAGVNKLEGIR